ncbi:Mrf1p KNAG_0I00720 [Huiozyma naganishii CBS 8797]|uniref:Peptide chain release factor 1, mitochondrial n=1 Tax=Huiozyma naganishii (strain ATCC MYA-139 / BCRC 22969 / CBS 8797 / KCTC 17520 / NBRC 10181 / NCYC 3082 / Yp74L-3) TaxID=1071383 RepID=J7RQ21_HUIN7|nr:hypothetical protein KNAG_0I00720 [Kazachstania naganishii CBS 8797]CCK71863.1 hypothetical protein KNAG_0I00720 [Kazachstania naganishii CBS 8797]
MWMIARGGKLLIKRTRGVNCVPGGLVPHGRVFYSVLVGDELNLKRLPNSLVTKAESYSKELTLLEESLSRGETFDEDKQIRYSRVSAVTDTLGHYRSILGNIRELNGMMATDPALKSEAEAELRELIPRFNGYAERLLGELLPPPAFSGKPCLMELRPGVGGVEAMNFTQDLTNMYINYAHKKRWKYHILSQQSNESGSGLIAAVLSIDEPGSYDRLRFESGVHRVQRVPDTETKGRTHTSTAAVVVLPQMGEESAKEVDAYERTFKPGEIRVDVKRASGKGGQHVNTTDSAVRLTHIPSGIVVSMQDERSQQKNRTKAFTLLRSRLAEKERSEKEARERAARREQVTTTNRSDKIRTYNYPQNRLTDHRCGFTLHDIPGVLSGERLDEVINAMTQFNTAEQAKRLLNDDS